MNLRMVNESETHYPHQTGMKKGIPPCSSVEAHVNPIWMDPKTD
jgi:hypothetical protein